MPEHIHFFVKADKNTFNLPKFVQHLKGFSPFMMRKRFKHLAKYKAFWSKGYFAESIGNISANVIRKYIENQKNKLKENI